MASRDVKYHNKVYKISYEIKNIDFDNYILILHGWGANKEIMVKAFSSHFKNLKQIYVDLPGFGNSDIFNPLTTKDYKNIIENFIKSFNKEPYIIMGHSFGGKVATLLNPKNLVLLSTAGIMEKKSLIVKLKILIFKILKFIGFGKFYSLFATKDVAGMSRIMYETLKNVVNEDFKNIFSKFDGNALIFWGENDKAVSLKSGELIHRMIKKSEFFPLNGDHFFFLLHADFIAKKIELSFKEDTIKKIKNEAFDELDEISSAGEVFIRKNKKTNNTEINNKITEKVDNSKETTQKNNQEKEKINEDGNFEQDFNPNVVIEELKYSSNEDDNFEEDIKFAIENVEKEKEHFIKNPMDKYKNLDEISEVGEVFVRKNNPKKEETNEKEISKNNIKDTNIKVENKQNLTKKDIKESINIIKNDTKITNQDKKIDIKNIIKDEKKYTPNLEDTLINVENHIMYCDDKKTIDSQNLNKKETLEKEKIVKSFTQIYKERLNKTIQKNKQKSKK